LKRLLPALIATALAIAGCGGDPKGPRLTVSAAASLKRPFTDYARGFEGADVRLSFAGSDQLAAQIRAGARPDVFAAANTELPDELFAAGLLERPVRFAANRLVVAVPAGGAKVKRFEDLSRRGVTIATGSSSVPVGSYANQVLARIPLSRRRALIRNIRDREPDVSGIVAKIAQGAVDAGFVYATDVEALGGKLRAIELPARLRPRVAYSAAVVRGTEHPDEATRFVRDLIRGDGAQALRRAGFEPPP
jgi:molybdate transport system substrate-binding protein